MKRGTSKKTLGGNRKKDEGLLTNVAESIGSTIGTIVGSAKAAQKTIAKSDAILSFKGRGKKFARRSKTTRRGSKTRH
jgi:hypothetical protein